MITTHYIYTVVIRSPSSSLSTSLFVHDGSAVAFIVGSSWKGGSYIQTCCGEYLGIGGQPLSQHARVLLKDHRSGIKNGTLCSSKMISEVGWFRPSAVFQYFRRWFVASIFPGRTPFQLLTRADIPYLQ